VWTLQLALGTGSAYIKQSAAGHLSSYLSNSMADPVRCHIVQCKLAANAIHYTVCGSAYGRRSPILMVVNNGQFIVLSD
jgi:hypothetical protein